MHDSDGLEEWVVDDEADDDQDCTLVCPVCSAAVHEDTQQCPACGDWIVPIYPSAHFKRWVWIVAVALVLLSFLIMTIR